MLNEAIHVAVPTAFDKDENLDTIATIKHIQHLAEAGVRSVLLAGSTGEQHSMSTDEKIELAKAVNKTSISHDLECLFGVSAVRQKDAENLLTALNELDSIKAILLGFPPYIRPCQKELLFYIRSLVNLSQKPVILYDNLARTGTGLDFKGWQEVLDLPQVIGVKNLSEKSWIAPLKARYPYLHFYAGGEEELLSNIEAGCTRLSSVIGNLYPQQILEEVAPLLEGKSHCISSDLQDKIDQLSRHSSVPYLKEKIGQQGLAMYCRAPLGQK